MSTSTSFYVLIQTVSKVTSGKTKDRYIVIDCVTPTKATTPQDLCHQLILTDMSFFSSFITEEWITQKMMCTSMPDVDDIYRFIEESSSDLSFCQELIDHIHSTSAISFHGVFFIKKNEPNPALMEFILKNTL